MTLKERLLEREKHIKHRTANRNSKANEKLRNYGYQRNIDHYKRNLKKKGNGRAHKEKGQTMPTMLCSNSRCAKSWKHLNGNPMRGESMKVAIIFSIT